MSETIIIRDGVLRDRVLDLIRALNLEKPWRVTVEPYRKQRSLSQNAMYWMWLTEVAKRVEHVTGYDKEEIHDFLKAKFLQPKIIEIGGDILERYSTKKLTTKEMSEYCEKVERWAASELGILLPRPEDMQRAA